MNTQPHTLAVPAQQTTYRTGDYVVYRDADKFWAGEGGHTFVCRIIASWKASQLFLRYDLVCLKTHRVIKDASPDYMRLLPPLDAMHDIDTAPLGEDTALTPAAVAWLRQQYTETTATS
ncbi:hypothetical protein [Streptomyces sp. 35G-GA-8]|uniref:hypothetical protein n=1 Tax=Streptomyces sp. 35G-GA-8 TaxID=2939434 RepID=UPI00201E9C78|nr:hypothetical protein [Streptomyces sp. 35G-GA-8]MCL7382192.1 hypothetical protein [Streptomyces sp. 35G-GA-8]